MIRGDDIALRPQSRLIGIEVRFLVDQLVKSRDVLLRRDSPKSSGRGCGPECDALGERTEQQVMIDEVAFIRIEISSKPTLVLHDACQLADNPIRKAESVDNIEIRSFCGWHLLQCDLSPD